MIYLLEDDANIRKFVVYALESRGFKSRCFERPSQLWEALENDLPDLLLLDIMLPEEDGYKVLAKIRGRSDTRALPVIFLTAKGTEADKISGLDVGADDYVAKPFSMLELIARIKALLRRADGHREEKEYRIGDLYVNPSRHIVTVEGENVALTFKEFELLFLLASHQGRVVTREDILRKVWDTEFYGESRTVDVHVRTLRSKLGPCGSLIETVRGVGYKIGGGENEG